MSPREAGTGKPVRGPTRSIVVEGYAEWQQMARAAATDTANAQMRTAGRTAWSRADYNLAIRTFNDLFPYVEVHTPSGSEHVPRADFCVGGAR